MKKIFQLLLVCLMAISAQANENLLDLHFGNSSDLVCDVSISMDSTNSGDVILTANPTGDAPFAYLWSTGETTQTVVLNQWGVNYCVTVTDASGCSAASCLFSAPNCSVYIVDNTTNGLTAIASGLAPFSYLWSNGGTGQSIQPNAPGTYCVSVTDANGCVSSDCYSYGCSVWIFESDTIGMTGLYAIASPWNVNYLWSNGETGAVIFPTTAGTYCVTITGGGCTANACYNYQTASNYSISGYLYLPDSTTNATILEGTVELFFNAPNTNVWESVATTDIESNPSGWSNFYSFGVQSEAGQYLVKATLDPTSPYAGDYLPTYHLSTVNWDEANVITLPSFGSGLFNIIFSDGQNLTSGSGNINGTVTEGDGFADNDEGSRSGDPRPNTSVLLFDSNELPISHTLTDDLGKYTFANLPYGTYKLEVEIVGIDQVERWVTLSAENPTSDGNDFEVTPDGIVLGINNLIAESILEVFPNPTTNQLNLAFEAKANFDAKFSVARPDGTVVLIENQQVTKGAQFHSFNIADLPIGLYLLQVTTGTEVISRKIVKK